MESILEGLRGSKEVKGLRSQELLRIASMLIGCLLRHEKVLRGRHEKELFKYCKHAH